MKVVSPHRLLLVLFCYINCIAIQTVAYSQKVQRQTVSAQGGVHTIANGLVFSQSIGQMSVVGTSKTSTFTFQQGFQQLLVAGVNNLISVPDFSVTLFPNPVTDSFTLTMTNAPKEPITIKIINIMGQVLYQGQMASFQSQMTIPFASYPGGTYLVQLFAGNKITTKKIIKI